MSRLKRAYTLTCWFVVTVDACVAARRAPIRKGVDIIKVTARLDSVTNYVYKKKERQKKNQPNQKHDGYDRD